VVADTLPRLFPEKTSETVDCETPACRATSTLVTRGRDLLVSVGEAMCGMQSPAQAACSC